MEGIGGGTAKVTDFGPHALTPLTLIHILFMERRQNVQRKK